jgi:hypothetical protein
MIPRPSCTGFFCWPNEINGLHGPPALVAKATGAGAATAPAGGKATGAAIWAGGGTYAGAALVTGAA